MQIRYMGKWLDDDFLTVGLIALLLENLPNYDEKDKRRRLAETIRDLMLAGF